LRTQTAEILARFCVKSQLWPERLCIEGPSLDEGRVVAETTEPWQARLLALQRELKMMARHGFVEKERLGSSPWIDVDARCVDVKNAWPRSVGSRRPIL